jgi:tight adherence protein C
MSAEDFCVARVLAALAGGALLLLVFPDSPAKAVVAGLAAGWLGLAMWLRMLCAKRKEAILISLPGALDGLALSVEAGLDFGQALGRVALRIGSGPLKEEFERLDSAMRIGVPRREALKAMSVRAGVRELSSFSTLLIQADILGTGVGPVLRTVSARLRSARLARAERKGILAAQKALLPLAFCIMPATFVVVFGPLIVRFAAGGIEGLF